jgi:peptide/nickel transport system substrate-binding protein
MRLPSIAPVVVVIACASLVGAATACKRPAPGAQAQTGAGKKNIVIGVTQEPDTLWMPMKQMNISEHIGRPGALCLTVFDDKWNLIPWAAESIPTVENKGVELMADGRMRVTWTLREGLFWADGIAVTSDDFLFTHKLYEDPNLEIVDRTISDRVLSMEAKDTRTFVVTFKEPYAYYAMMRNHEVVPRHIVEPLWQTKGAALKDDPFGTTPVLGGAFTIKEWVPGSHITAVRNPYAVAFKPKLDEIVWRIIPQTSTLEANLLSGSIDVIGVIGLTFDQALQLEKRLPPHLELRLDRAMHFEHVDMSMDNPILADQRVREALLLSADRASIVSTLFEGKLEIAHSFEAPGSPFHNPDVRKRAFDPERAKALLDEAGWKPGPDGVRVNKDGARLSLPFATTAGDKVRELVQEILVASWKAVGVEVTVQNQPAKLLFGESLRRRKLSGLAMFTWSKDPVQLNEAFWRCDQIPSEKNGWKGQNYPGYCNPKMDALLAQMVRELDDKKRAAIGREVDALLAEELPQLPLYFRKEISVVPKNLVGWKPTGLLSPMAWNAHEWEWR